MKKILIVFSIFAFLLMLAGESLARAGKGSSSGFRSYKQQPQQPSQSQPGQQNINKTPAQPAQPMQKPSFLNSGMFKWLIGGLFIGALLSFLMGQGFNFGMPGLFEILIICGIIFLVVRMIMKSRQKERLQYATSGSYSSQTSSGYSPTDNLYNTNNNTTQSSATISVNEKLIKDIATSTFKLLQDAWSKNDLSIVRNLLTDRMYNYLNNQLQELKSQGLKNVVEIVYFQNVSIVDVEGEDDNKVAIVQIEALLRDYTLDRNDYLVEGSKDSPVEAKEYWAFVGKALEWKLDDIKQV